MRHVGNARMAGADATTYAAFAGAVLIGGANFVAVTFSNMELPPVFGAALRFGLATLIFLVIARAAGVSRPDRRAAAGAVAYGLLGFGVSYAALYYALVGLAAGTVAVIMAAVPLFTLAIAAVLGQEHLTGRGVGGGLLAVVGIAILSIGAVEGGMGGSYLVAAIVGTLAAAASSVVARGYRHVHPVTMNAIGMGAGTVLLAGGSLALGESWALPRDGQTVAAVAWLVLLGSVGLFQLFLYVIRRWTASAAAYAITAMPVVAAGLAVVLLDQPVTLELLLGGAMVIAAVYVGALSGRARNPRLQQKPVAPGAEPVARGTPPASGGPGSA